MVLSQRTACAGVRPVAIDRQRGESPSVPRVGSALVVGRGFMGVVMAVRIYVYHRFDRGRKLVQESMFRLLGDVVPSGYG